MARSRLAREGTLGLFIILGGVIFGGLVFFLRGMTLGQDTYQLRLQFDNVGGLREGGRVLYRGMEVGKITAITPDVNGIEVITDIDSTLKIPKDLLVETTQSGLLGEIIITMSPQSQLTDGARQINPLSPECNEQNEIICDQDVIKGQFSGDLIASMTKLTVLLSDPVFFGQLNQAVVNTAKAGENVALLSNDLSAFIASTRKDLDKLSTVADSVIATSESFANTANVTSEQINRLADQFSTTATEISALTRNTNELIENNKSTLNETVVSLSETSKEATQLIKNANNVVGKLDRTLDQVDTVAMAENINQAIANLETITNNLNAVSQELNNPTNLVALQQTLDSARVTFANTAKITSDIDDLTGDAQFRDNVRRLVDGLSSLISYTDMLEKQVELATILHDAQQITAKQSTSPQIFQSQNSNHQLLK
ncbi:MAG: MCE family protein [Cyanobacterium sp. T60_A2020_053]|nr:MCE family protein [Cyanobacterium sp. T60_A2020_053]